MKRYVDLFLAGLALAAAAVVATRRQAASETGPAPAGAGRTPTPVVTTAPAPEPHGVVQTALSVVKAVMRRMKEHGTIILAAGLSYYALLAAFPAAIAAVSIYGLVADPAVLESQLAELTSALPTATGEFVGEQLEKIVNASSSSLGLATTLSIVAALWSASAGTKALISGINYAYGRPETRSFLALRLSALGVTFSIILFGLSAATAVAFLPQILDAIGLESAAANLIEIARWPVVLVVVVLGLGALYKLAPDRPWRMTRWISKGAVIAAGIWVLATLGLSVYVNNFGASLGETYGTLTGLIVLMLWFFASGSIILVGAEINSELEHRHLAA